MFTQRKKPRLALVDPERRGPSRAAPTVEQHAVASTVEQHAVAESHAAEPHAVEQHAAVEPHAVEQHAAVEPHAVEQHAAVEPLLDAIPMKKREQRRQGAIPPFLVHGGNHKTWQSLAKTILTERLATILLHGPHGCGKTRGLHDLAMHHMAMTVYELNASNVEGIERFAKDVRHVTRTKTLLGPRILLIDDLEGFDESYIAKTVELIKGRKEGDGPLVITCHNIFDRALVKLRTLPLQCFRMFEPRPRDMVAAVKTIVNCSPSLIADYAEESHNNYHQLLLRLRTHAPSHTDERVGLFETTQSLLKRQTAPDRWQRVGEPHTLIALLHENAMVIAARGTEHDELERCARFLDAVSATACLPTETHVEVIGQTAQIELHTLDVPPLHLSKRITVANTDRSFEQYDSLRGRNSQSQRGAN